MGRGTVAGSGEDWGHLLLPPSTSGADSASRSQDLAKTCRVGAAKPPLCISGQARNPWDGDDVWDRSDLLCMSE